MSKMIQIRNVPDGLHGELKARAARAGMTLSDYLLRELRESVSRPATDELWERLRRRGSVEPSIPVAEIVRQERHENVPRGRRRAARRNPETG